MVRHFSKSVRDFTVAARGRNCVTLFHDANLAAFRMRLPSCVKNLFGRPCRTSQDAHWTEVVSGSEAEVTSPVVSGHERKRREAVWELFTSQCVFLFDHLMALKHVR